MTTERPIPDGTYGGNTFTNCTLTDAPPEGGIWVPKTADGLPPAWAELIEGLTILAEARTDDVSPLHAEHDMLNVAADPERLSADELARLEEIGFHPEPDGGFYFFT